jgi:hypothetical protein
MPHNTKSASQIYSLVECIRLIEIIWIKASQEIRFIKPALLTTATVTQYNRDNEQVKDN